MKQIPLSGQNGEGKFALVDDEDYAAVSAYSWYLSRGYAKTKIRRKNSKNRKILCLHNLVTGDPLLGLVVDHIDGNPLNNQRANLRFVTAAQNAQNIAPRQNTSSRFKGVSWHNKWELWIARICHNKTQIDLGHFMSEIDAARAYNEAATQYFGEFARLNTIPDDAIEPIRYRQAVPLAHSRTSQYRGVSLPTYGKRWRAKLKVAGKTVHLGLFDTEEDAARAYDVAAKLHHGDRAFLNFPDVI